MSQATTGNSMFQLEFEKPLLQLEAQIAQIEAATETLDDDATAEVGKLRSSHEALLNKTYENLTAWQTVQVSRHPNRPQAVDYVRMFVKDFCELHGDRHFGDDPAIVTGFGRIGQHKCLIVGHNKGKDTKEK
ncbi:MAG: acetyl-CoA carboxylase carboxyl transferase subunit alpha, partial [Planctomycetota bacterium]